MRKTMKGFTLVELVVVIAIIGVLAAILVPSMLNYVRKAQLRSANANAKTAYNAVAEYITAANVNGKSLQTALSEFTEASSATGLDCTTNPSNDADKTITDAISNNGSAAGTVWVLGSGKSVTINGEEGFAVQWAVKDINSNMWGQYPDPISWDDYKNYILDTTKKPGTYRSTWS